MATTKVPNNLIDLSGDSGALPWAAGTTAQRPASPNSGDFRYNTDLNKFEFYNGTDWRLIVPIAFMDFLLVAGGGGSSNGAGGAGGLLTSYGSVSGGGGPVLSPFSGAGETYVITIGAGGNYSSDYHYAPGMGGDSSIVSSNPSTNLYADGGGRGGSALNIYTPGTTATGLPGGSGGGGGLVPSTNPGYVGGAGTGTTNQGYPGGQSRGEPYPSRVVFGSGGGAGGAGIGGYSPTGYQTISGCLGLAVDILNSTNASSYSVGDVSGTDVYYASGGAAIWISGSTWSGAPNPLYGPVSPGGGGSYSAGAANTGGGGARSYNGGSGVCILRMTTDSYTGVTTGNPSVVTEGDDTILIYTGSGSYTA